jgi:ketosteroid isomerase-like protein
VTITYAAAGELLDAWVNARTKHDGDAFTTIFEPDATLALDPWDAPLAGGNALRAYLLAAASAEKGLEMIVERHWVSGDTVLAAWHAGWRGRDGAAVRQAGFVTADIGSSGRIMRMRLWTVGRNGGAEG